MSNNFWLRPQAHIWAVLALVPVQVVLFIQVRNMGATALLRAMEGQPERLTMTFVSANMYTYLFLATAVLDVVFLLAAAAMTRTRSR
jgi:hypothetical protein